MLKLEKAVSHRCKELLEYGNKRNRVSIRWNKDEDEWILSFLDYNPEDWDIKWPNSVCCVKYCPFCGMKLPSVNPKPQHAHEQTKQEDIPMETEIQEEEQPFVVKHHPSKSEPYTSYERDM